MNNRYQSGNRKSKGKFEVLGGRELAVRLPLPLAEVWEELQVEVERLTGKPACRFCGPCWRRCGSGWGLDTGPSGPARTGAGAGSQAT